MQDQIDLTQTFMDAVGTDLRGKVDWDKRLGASGVQSFNSADGSFGDVVSSTQNSSFDKLGFTGLLWSYGVLLGDTRTPKEVVARILPPLTQAFVQALNETPIAEQQKGDLVNFMDNYNRSRASGRFDASGVAEIAKVMRAMADNFSAKCNAERDEKFLAETVAQAMNGLPDSIRVAPALKLK